MANTYGRQVVVALTNKSGGAVAIGDVVIVDTSNNDAFTTTTSGGFTGGIGVAQAAIASNATGLVLLSGYAALVNVNASVTRGNFGKTYTVVKQATDAGAARAAGTFCQFLTGGTTPDAVVYPSDLAAAALTNPMTTKGDIIQGDTGGTPTRLAAGTSGYVLTAGGAGAFSAWAAPAAGGTLAATEYNLGGSNVTLTTAGSYYQGPNGTPAAGTYLCLGVAAFRTGGSGNRAFTSRITTGGSVASGILTGGTNLDEVEEDAPSASGNDYQAVTWALAVMDGLTTISLTGSSATATVDHMVSDTQSNSPTTLHRATKLTLIKIA